MAKITPTELSNHSIEALEWPIIQDKLMASCQTPFGQKLWENAPFLPDAQAVETHIEEVSELKTLILRYGEPLLDSEPIQDISSSIKRVKKGSELNSADLGKMLNTLKQGSRFLKHFKHSAFKERSKTPCINKLFEGVETPTEVIQTLEKTVNLSGDILDEASLNLSQLREKFRNQRRTIYEKLQRILHTPELAKVLQQPIITERDGRYVLPVQIAFKSKIPGVIHAGSSSGATVFIEPNRVIEHNNALQETQTLIQKEQRHILKEISLFIELHRPCIEKFIHCLATVDKRFSAARLSRKLDANAIELVLEDQVIDLKKARHPLLLFTESDATKIIANDIQLGQDENRTLIITGPNTGGKTVLLKTVGLFALMIRAGLHLPVNEGSKMSLFDPVLADIGDQQSIAQSLSTFSAHLAHLSYFVADETVLSKGLILIDEICAGTDPAEGGALARSVLKELYNKGGISIVTTHLGELKLEAHEHPGYLNASVEFDPENLKPTYRLIIGVPGASNAITIARRLGLKTTVTERAKSYLSQPLKESAELLEDLERKNRKLGETLHHAESYKKSTQEAYEKVAQQRHQIESSKRQTLQQFKASLKDRIYQMEAEIKHLKKELIKTHEAARNKSLNEGDEDSINRTHDHLKQLEKKANTIFDSSYAHIEEESEKLLITDLTLGDTVQSKKWNVKGEVISLDNAHEIIIQSGLLKVTVPLTDLQFPLGKPGQKKGGEKKNKRKKLNQGRPQRLAQKQLPQTQHSREFISISLECNLLGLRVEEAIEKMEQFLDKASLANHQAVSIIHGHGTGALKKAVRAYLKKSPYAQNFYPGSPQTGGDGQTIIELR